MVDFAPDFQVVLGGRDLSVLGYKDSVRRILVEEHDVLADVVKVELINVDEELTNDVLFQEKGTMTLSLGIEGELQNFGTFVLEEPVFHFPEGDSPVLVIVGFGQDLKLAATEKRRTFRQVTDSQIANIIASEYGLKTFDDKTGDLTIETTSENYEEVVQLNESDMTFLQRRAEMNGFLVFVERGSLHFHSMKYKTPDTILRWGRPERSVPQFGGLARTEYDLLDARFRVRSFLKGRKLTESNRDKLQKRGVTWTSLNEPDALTQRQLSDPNLRRASEVTAGLGVQPEEFLVNRGQAGNLSEVQRLATEGAKARQFIVEGRLKTKNAPKVRSRSIVTLKNVGQFSGEVYVKATRHEIDPERGGYVVRADVRRTTVGRLAPGTSSPRPSSTVSSGSMRPRASEDTLRGTTISQQGVLS
jgi:phage protein D